MLGTELRILYMRYSIREWPDFGGACKISKEHMGGLKGRKIKSKLDSEFEKKKVE